MRGMMSNGKFLTVGCTEYVAAYRAMANVPRELELLKQSFNLTGRIAERLAKLDAAIMDIEL